LRILFVDDEETFLRATCELLRREGYQCDAAASTVEGLALLETNPYDLVIADIKMPGNLDLEFVRQLATRSDAPPVILATGYPSMSSAIESIELPVIAYLVKPFDIAELLAKLRTVGARAGALRAMRGELARWHEYRQSLVRIESHLSGQPAGPHAQSLNAFVAATVRNVVDSLGNLRDLAKAVEGSSTQRDVEHWTATVPSEMREVLRDVVATLERTRSAFKSKELGELRRRLETLLKE
jgi:DNA-binding response OmpR family regulator